MKKCSASGMSVVQLYAAALLPGFLLAGMYVVYVVILAKLKPQLMPPLPREQGNVPAGEVVVALLKSFVPLALLMARSRSSGQSWAAKRRAACTRARWGSCRCSMR